MRCDAAHRNSFKEAWGHIVVADKVGKAPELPSAQAPISYVRFMPQDIAREEVINELAALTCSMHK